MNCNEEIKDIVKIEAYPLDSISIPVPHFNAPSISRSLVMVQGTPMTVSMAENSAQAKTAMKRDQSGTIYEISLNWQSEDTSGDTLAHIGELIQGQYHFILHTYDGKVKLYYNWCGYGKVLFSNSMATSDESYTLSISQKSRFPILTLTE